VKFTAYWVVKGMVKFTAYWVVKGTVKTHRHLFYNALNITMQWVLLQLHIRQDSDLNLGGYLPAQVMSDCCPYCEAITNITLVNIRSLFRPYV